MPLCTAAIVGAHIVKTWGTLPALPVMFLYRRNEILTLQLWQQLGYVQVAGKFACSEGCFTATWYWTTALVDDILHPRFRLSACT